MIFPENQKYMHVPNMPNRGQPLPPPPPTFKLWVSPRPAGLYSQPAHLLANANFVPLWSVGEPFEGKGYVANPSTCVPLLFFSPPWRIGDPLVGMLLDSQVEMSANHQTL